MHKLRIRSFSLLALVFIVSLPWVFYLAALLIETQSIELGKGRPAAFPHIAAIAGLVLAFVVVGVQMRRFLLRPLEKMGLAARRIAEGDLDDAGFSPSGIAEIAELRDAFNMMVNGLVQSNRKRREMEEERRFVLAAIAHDLRTPLFALRGYLEGLEQGLAQSPEKTAKYVAVCKEKSAQLDLLVEDLFTFAKLEYEEKGLLGKAVDLGLVMRKAIDSLSPLAQNKHVSIVEDDSADDCLLIGDSHLLERAMNNLLDNAVRHSPPHGRISVGCSREGGRVTFTVRDMGEGFDSGELERVFEPLYRGEESRNRSTGGAGLGLTIARKIIRRHGGEIVARNHPEGGAVLSGWLPASPEP